jgi:hypothetical protein
MLVGGLGGHNGGSRVTTATGDRHTARLPIQSMGELIADSVLEVSLVQLSCMASISAVISSPSWVSPM